jgi:hypothetical protein
MVLISSAMTVPSFAERSAAVRSGCRPLPALPCIFQESFAGANVVNGLANRSARSARGEVSD